MSASRKASKKAVLYNATAEPLSPPRCPPLSSTGLDAETRGRARHPALARWPPYYRLVQQDEHLKLGEKKS